MTFHLWVREEGALQGAGRKFQKIKHLACMEVVCASCLESKLIDFVNWEVNKEASLNPPA